jgi:GMP synthase (glutamine-hydrolysing)
MFVVIDCGSQLTNNIARCIRELGCLAHLLPHTATWASVADGSHPVIAAAAAASTSAAEAATRATAATRVEGIVISGGPSSVHDAGAPTLDRAFFEQSEVPVLCICYGMQYAAHALGGAVSRAEVREYGSCQVEVDRAAVDCALIAGTPTSAHRPHGWPEPTAIDTECAHGPLLRVWMSHGDVVDALPDGFRVVARSHESRHIAIAENVTERAARGLKGLYMLQFHPEVSHTVGGMHMIENFVVAVCNANTSAWSPTHVYDKIVADTKAQIAGKVGIVAVSGGVDSTTLAVFLSRIPGAVIHPIYIDNGLMRHRETERVREIAAECGLDNMRFIDASARFLARLDGVLDADEQRKIIGHEFIAIFEEEARALPGKVDYLAQGTLYPDVIESIAPLGQASHKIKRHHNVGGLPDKMDLEVVEPFRLLFKDEVRRIAREELGMPDKVVDRHPFPGPGLAVRMFGPITEDRLARLRHADAVFIDCLHKFNIYNEISQAGAIATGLMSTAVSGDAAANEEVMALRAVVTTDFMTADFYMFTQEQLSKIATRIVNEVEGVSRVLYDISAKPKSTIEHR